MSKSKQDATGFHVFVFLLVLINVLLVLVYFFLNPQQENSGEENSANSANLMDKKGMANIRLYFLSDSGKNLIPIDRSVKPQTDVLSKARQVIEELAKGPLESEGGGLYSSIVKGFRFREIYFDNQRIFIDMDRSIENNSQLSVHSELMMVQSLTNSLVELEDVESIRFLKNGKEVSGFSETSGMLNLQQSFYQDMSLVR